MKLKDILRGTEDLEMLVGIVKTVLPGILGEQKD